MGIKAGFEDIRQAQLGEKVGLVAMAARLGMITLDETLASLKAEPLSRGKEWAANTAIEAVGTFVLSPRNSRRGEFFDRIILNLLAH